MVKNETLILEPVDYNQKAIAVYSSLGNVTFEHESNELISTIVCRLGFHLNMDFLKQYPSLRYIVSPTTGLNHIDLNYCEDKGITVISLKGEVEYLNSIRSTSEHTIALILALVRNLVPSVNSVVDKNQWDRDQFKGRELSSLTIGILGAGRIGKHIISYANAFGMSVLVHDPNINPLDFQEQKITFCSKKELFSQADVLSVHVDYHEKNVGLISKNDFNFMKNGSFFVNTSRGELVIEEDLIWALKNKILAGAALDVLSDEQDMDSFFDKKIIQYAKKNNNVIITPHIGGCTSDAMWNTELFMAKKFKNLIHQKN